MFPSKCAYASSSGSSSVVSSPMRGRRFWAFGSLTCERVISASSTRRPAGPYGTPTSLVQHPCRRVALECRTHGEGFLAAVGYGPTAVEVDGKQADVRVMAPVQRSNAFLDRRERLRRVGQYGFRRACGRCSERQPTEQRLPPRQSSHRLQVTDQPAMLRSGCGRDFFDRCGPRTAAP